MFGCAPFTSSAKCATQYLCSICLLIAFLFFPFLSLCYLLWTSFAVFLCTCLSHSSFSSLNYSSCGSRCCARDSLSFQCPRHPEHDRFDHVVQVSGAIFGGHFQFDVSLCLWPPASSISSPIYMHIMHFFFGVTNLKIMSLSSHTGNFNTGLFIIVYFKIPGPWFFGRKIKSTYSILKIQTFLKRL